MSSCTCNILCLFFFYDIFQETKENATEPKDLKGTDMVMQWNLTYSEEPKELLIYSKSYKVTLSQVLCIICSLRKFRNNEDVLVRVSKHISENKLFLMKPDQLSDKRAVMSWVIYGKRFRKQIGGGEYSPL